MAPDALSLAKTLEEQIAAEFKRLIAIVLREITPILLARGAKRDAVSLPELFRQLQTHERPEASLRRLFQQVNKETDAALERRLPGLPIPAVVSKGAQLQEAWVRRNTDLIKAQPRVQRAVEQVLAQPLDRGLRVEEIKAQLEDQLGIASRRAQLIARDQTLKLAGQLQEARQTQAGIRRYVWTTSGDERVRHDHAILDGTIQSWDSPPVVDQRTGRRGHPGDDFQCRCTADPVLDEPLDGLPQQPREAEPTPPPEPEPEPVPQPEPPAAPILARQQVSAEAIFQQAQEFSASRAVGKTSAAAAALPAIEGALPGKSLQTLKAIPFTLEELATDASLRFLRTDPIFAATGNVGDNFGSSKQGLPQISIEPDGTVHLTNGRHRLTVARELGLKQIAARIRKFGPRGGVLWEFVGMLKV